jgi:HEAT repeat protein
MPLYPELETLPLEDLIALFRDPYLDGDDGAVMYYDEVGLAIRRWGDQGDAFLRALLPGTDEGHTRSILFALSCPPLPTPPVKSIILPYLHDVRPSVVASAIEALAPFAEAGDNAEVLQHATNESPYVRGSVLRYLAFTRKQGAAPFLIEALEDSHPVVIRTAIDALGDQCVTDALPALLRFLDDADPDTRDAASLSVEHLKICSDDNHS